MQRQELEKLFTERKQKFFQSWQELLEIPSISTDPERKADCARAAEWLKVEVEKLGFNARLLTTKGKPVLFAEWKPENFDPASDRTVLFYGHYDVQPADPLELWSSQPFQPQWRAGRLYARGAQDNKGQLMYVLKALEVLIPTGQLNCRVKLLIEGEEECGSVGLAAALAEWDQDLLKSDVLLVCDTGSRSPEVAALTMGLRGIVSLTVTLRGPRTDLHSGVHGGVAPNPARELARLVSSLHDETGKVAVAGFYDGIEQASGADLQLANQVQITPEMYQQASGVRPSLEQGYSFAECRGFRPTLEINGIHSGYAGAGSKTIIPSSAFVKISCRIVAGQQAEQIVEKIRMHLMERVHPELQLEISEVEPAGGALRLSTSSPVIQKAADCLKKSFDGPIEYMWEGASIPIIGRLAERCGAEPVLVGFGLEEDNIHAPNESFSEDQFRHGFLFAGLFLSQL